MPAINSSVVCDPRHSQQRSAMAWGNPDSARVSFDLFWQLLPMFGIFEKLKLLTALPNCLVYTQCTHKVEADMFPLLVICKCDRWAQQQRTHIRTIFDDVDSDVVRWISWAPTVSSVNPSAYKPQFKMHGVICCCVWRLAEQKAEKIVCLELCRM